MAKHIIVAGAGLSGLSCARHLIAHGVDVTVLESSYRAGGRVGGDRIDGYMLDRGYQVFLDAYPEARSVLDYAALDLKSFYPGAFIRLEDRQLLMAHPFKKPLAALRALFAPLARAGDYPKLLKLFQRLRRDVPVQGEEQSTLEALHALGLSDRVIQRFFKPFFGGVFFDRSLETSARMFEFTCRMFHQGNACLPAEGMQAIPDQLLQGLPKDTVRFQMPVTQADKHGVTLENGDRVEADAVVLATDMVTTRKLTGSGKQSRWQGTATIYYTADEAPYRDKVLTLDGAGQGPINHLAVLTNVAPAYAPDGKALICANLAASPRAENDKLEASVLAHLRRWFGAQVGGWEHLKTYRIPKALPSQCPPMPGGGRERFRLGDGLYQCGDWLVNGSINGAMVAGRLASEQCLNDLLGMAFPNHDDAKREKALPATA